MRKMNGFLLRVMIAKQIISKAWNHLEKELNWFEYPLIYDELNERKKMGINY